MPHNLTLCVDAAAALTHLVIIVGAKVDGYKRQPDDACGIHCKANVLCLVKVFGNFTCFECVEGAQNDQNNVVDEWHH